MQALLESGYCIHESTRFNIRVCPGLEQAGPTNTHHRRKSILRFRPASPDRKTKALRFARLLMRADACHGVHGSHDVHGGHGSADGAHGTRSRIRSNGAGPVGVVVKTTHRLGIEPDMSRGAGQR